MATKVCPKCYGSGTVTKTSPEWRKNDHYEAGGYWIEDGNTREGKCYNCNGTGHVEVECFPAGTLIKTPDGVIDIASAREGDLVLSFDPRRNVLRCRRILKVCKHGMNQISEIKFTDGSGLRTTASHSIRVAGTWKQACHVRKGDVICCYDASGQLEARQVAFSSPTTVVEEVFNLIVEGEFSFVADGVVAHSFTYFRALRMMWWTIYGTLQDWVRDEPAVASDRGRITVSRMSTSLGGPGR